MGSFVLLVFELCGINYNIAVFENIITMTMEWTGWSHSKTIKVSFVLVFVLSLPCALGFNVLSFIQPLGAGSTIQDLEDFIVSNNLLPLGSLCYVLFCTSKYGWGFKNFLKEANCGEGISFPKQVGFYVSYVIPVIILVIFIQGYISKFL